MIKNLFCLLFFAILLVACNQNKEVSSIKPANWEKRTIAVNAYDSLVSGSSYLSVYSQIYGMTEHRTYDLTATVSMRNISSLDTLFIERADYYNTAGEKIRSYFKKPIFLKPLETVEIVIDQTDKEGGTGANFIFDWKIKPNSNEPFFECVMISTSGQQGLSFSTHGVKIQND